MTAEALPIDWELPANDGDPDATWTDLLKGRRGRKLPEAATAFLPAARTMCLPDTTPARVPVAPPPEHTCLGELVPGALAPRVAGTDDLAPPSVDALPDIPTVGAYHEQLIERVARSVSEPGIRRSEDDLPAIARGALGAATPCFEAVPDVESMDLPEIADAGEVERPGSPWSPAESAPRAGTPALSAPAALRVCTPLPADDIDARYPDLPAPIEHARIDARYPDLPAPVKRARSSRRTPAPRRDSLDYDRADTTPSQPKVEVVSSAEVKAALQTPASLVKAAVPTWAAQATQMEGPGVWMETNANAPVKARARAKTVVPPQKHVPTAISPVACSAVQAAPRKRSLMDEVVPFALVLVAISLATAAIVGAYL